MKQIQIGTYGSLKEGFHNHRGLGENKEFVGKDKITGTMFLRYNYPHLYLNSQNPQITKEKPTEHTLEVYKIDQEHFNVIDRMEKSSGYEQEKIKTIYGETIIWVNKDYFPPGLKYIKEYTKETLQ